MRALKRLRRSANLTQEAMVDALNTLARRLHDDGRIAKPPTFSVRQLSKWESEKAPPPWPHPDTRAVLAIYWKRPVEELGLRPAAADDALTAISVPMISQAPPSVPMLAAASSSPLTDEAPPPWLAETTTGTNRSGEWRIAPEEVDFLSAAADDNYAIDQQFGGNRLWRPTRAHLLWTHHMIDRGIYDDPLGQQLHALAGKLTTSLGWFCYDAGLQAQARQYFSEALNAANYTGDDILASRTLSNMARQAVDLNKGREAVRFAKLGQRHAELWNAPSLVTALLAIREAQGHARLGDVFNCEAAIKRSWQEWERGNNERDPDWALFLNLAELTCLEGMCRLDLGQAARAQTLLAQSEELQDVAHSRNRGMCLGRLSVAAVANGDVDHGMSAASKALQLVESGISSTRTAGQLKIVHDGMLPHRRARGVGDLLEQIRAHVA
ncbi:helix-turn-helix domain-containing protein [Streptomyces galilaeus]